MDLDTITADLVERTLRSQQQTDELPIELFNLDLLKESRGASPAELSLKLQDILTSLTVEALMRYRDHAGISASPPEQSNTEQSNIIDPIKTDLTTDFQPRNAVLEAWSALYHRYLAPFPLGVAEMAAVTHVAERQIRRRLATGVNLLVDALRRAERDAHLRFQTVYRLRHLPPSDLAPLIGIEPFVEQIVQLLATPRTVRLISIEGLGGIGKTALAHAIACSMAPREEIADILWIRAQEEPSMTSDLHAGKGPSPYVDALVYVDEIVEELATQVGLMQIAELPTPEKLDRLRPLLITTPYLVVIDNLETAETAHALLPLLYSLAGATRFLLTSRQTLQHFSYVYSFAVPELSLPQSHQLIEDVLISRHGRSYRLAPSTFQEIYETIGGVPLAIKLIAGQLRRLPLAYILEGLRHARQEAPERMFTHIYRRAWYLLDDHARALLLSMLLMAPGGDSLAWLRQVSNLSERHLEEALTQLLDHFLVEVTGSLEIPIYRLHRLTATFLQTDLLLDWQGAQHYGSL